MGGRCPVPGGRCPVSRPEATPHDKQFSAGFWAGFWAGEALRPTWGTTLDNLFSQVTGGIRSARPKGFEPLTF